METARVILKEFCLAYSLTMRMDPKNRPKNPFTHTCESLHTKFIKDLDIIDVKSFPEFKSFIARGLKKIRREKEEDEARNEYLFELRQQELLKEAQRQQIEVSLIRRSFPEMPSFLAH